MRNSIFLNVLATVIVGAAIVAIYNFIKPPILFINSTFPSPLSLPPTSAPSPLQPLISPILIPSGTPRAQGIKIIRPSNGETVKAGQVYSIKWEAQGIEKIWISLVQGGKDHGLIAEGIPAITGQHPWTPPTHIIDDFGSTGYKIFISNNSPTEEIRDESDGTFSIVK
jgi:hypothetical protein